MLGEFSKIAHVPGSLLRYYDEIGLLKPALVDRVTGYRHYSVEQLSSLNRIIALKDLGLSLEQITRMLDNHVTTEEIRSILHLQKVQLEQTVHTEMERLHRVEIRLQQLDAEGTSGEQDVVLKPLPSQLFFSVRTVTSNWKQVGELMREMAELLPLQVSPKSLSNLTVILYSDMYENVNVDIEVGYVLQDPLEGSLDLSDERTLRTRQLPGAETAATIFRFGKYENGLKSYCAIGTWIEKNGYQIVGPGREVSLRLPPPDKPDEAVTEIQFPVQRIAPTHFISPSE